jgi:pSer/pThr/pTyr-binding forkhead associated (FHA) protein
MTRDLELRIARQGEPSVRQVVFSQPFVLLGRHPANDLCVRDAAINARHVYLQVIQGTLFCFDIRGVAGAQGPFHGWLAPGLCLLTGPYRLWPAEADEVTESLSGRRVPLDPLQEEMPPDPSQPCFVLEVPQGAGRARYVRGTHRLTMIGRSTTCAVRLDHPSVSRFHCGVLNTPNGLWILDLLSREGTLVNGQRHRWAQLDDGDELRIGTFSLRLRYESPTLFSSGVEAAPATEHPVPEGRGVLALGPGQDRSPLVQEALTSPAPPLARLRQEQAFLLPIIEQFSLMQQQMFDQFHQSMAMLVELFSAMHREQTGLVRAELNQLHQLTRELQTLQDQLRKQLLPRGPEPPGVPAVRQPLPVQEPAKERKRDLEATPTRAGRRTPSVATPSSGAPEKSAPLQEEGTGNEIHAWLSRRIDELQRERQTRWQKLMQLMLGK